MARRCTRLLVAATAAAFVLLAHAGMASAATFVVNTVDDLNDGSCNAIHCSLREAVNGANANGTGHDLIAFDIAAPPPYSIKPVTPYPPVNSLVTVDGASEPDYSGTPIIELDGSLAGPGATGLHLTAGDSTIRALVVNRFFPGGRGIALQSNRNVVVASYVGTDFTGTLPHPNFVGIDVIGVLNRVGGSSPADRNVVSGNFNGIEVRGGSNTVAGNYVGTTPSGTAPNGNTNFGVNVTGTDNLIGGTLAGSRNVISGNTKEGLQLQSARNRVFGNIIGLDASGTVPLGNGPGFRGVIVNGGSLNRIGGPGAGERNVISGNNGIGVWIIGNSNSVQGNYIGTDITGTQPVGNSTEGVFVGPGSQNAIGGRNPGEGNRIAYNGASGVVVFDPTSLFNGILSNEIFQNGRLGIDLASNGVTPNDPGDADPGPNEFQNFPLLTAVSTSGGSSTVGGTLNSEPNTTYLLQFFANDACDPSGFGEGQRLVLQRLITTDAAGNAAFSYTIGSGGPAFTATATDPVDNTSELSNCAVDTGAGPPATVFLDPPFAENPVGAEHCVTATVTDATGRPTPGVTVEFTATGANAASGSAETNDSGEATFCYTGEALGEDAIRAFADTDGDGTEDPGEPFGVATKTWLPGEPAFVVLTPPVSENPVGTEHCVTATVTDAFGNATPDIVVTFEVTGANEVTGSAVTDESGQAEFCYTGANVGPDVISATAGHAEDPPVVSGFATKTWRPAAPAVLTLTPPAAENEVGTEHCVTATVTDILGNPIEGVVVRFTVTGSVSTDGSATTDENGQAEFCYQGPLLPGADVITAYADTDEDSVQDPGEPTGAAEKTWILPPSTEGCEVKITYGGWIVADNRDKSTFGGNAHVDSGAVKGQEEYQDHGPARPMNLHSTQILAVTCSEDRTRAEIYGRARVDGVDGFLFRIQVRDLGEPGRNDTYWIVVSNGYNSGDHRLEGGNVQIHTRS
jgi:CSLREA domain-containing protein